MKLLQFYFSNNEKSKREIKESIPFTIATKRIKYLGIDLPKETKHLYTKTIRCWWKQLKMTQIVGGTDYVLGLEESMWKWLYYNTQSIL